MNIKKTLLQTAVSLLVAFSLTTAFAQDVNTATDSTPALDKQQVKQVQQIIHDYLLTNPEILIAAGEELQKKQAEQQQQGAIAAISANKEQLFNDPNSPVIGNTKGNLILVEFYDYQCGHCKSMSSTIQSTLKENTNVKLILKELPIFGGSSKYAAEASLAIYKIAPNKFSQFHEQLLDVEGALNEEKILEVATSLGVKASVLQKQMEASSTEDELKNNFTLAGKIGIQGTPSFVIANGDLTKFAFIPGATSKEQLMAQFKSVE